MGANTSTAAGTRAVLDAVRRIVRALHESSRRAEQRVGLSGAQLFVLQKLDESPAMSVNDLAARTHTHQSSVSVVVARLVARRLVVRRRSREDGRVTELLLTRQGRQLVNRAPEVVQDRLVRAIDSLAASDRRVLVSALGTLAGAVDRVNRAPAMFFEEGSRRAPRRHADA